MREGGMLSCVFIFSEGFCDIIFDIELIRI